MPDAPDFTVPWTVRDPRPDMEPNTPYPHTGTEACSYAYTGYCTPHPTPHARDDLTCVLEPHLDANGNEIAGWVHARCPAHQQRWAATYRERATA